MQFNQQPKPPRFTVKSKWLIAFGVIFTACAALLGCKEGNMIDANKIFKDKGKIKLAKAVQKGDVKAIKALIAEGVDPNAQTIDDNRYNLLSWALLSQSKKGIVALLEAGVDPAVGNAEGRTILHLAAMANDPSYLTLFLEHGVNPNMRGKNGTTALWDATDRKEQFKALMAAGTDINARKNPVNKGSVGDTILHYAASTNTYERVLDLLAAGADPTALDTRGDTFQRSFFSISEEIMTDESKAERDQVRSWLRERNIPMESNHADRTRRFS